MSSGTEKGANCSCKSDSAHKPGRAVGMREERNEFIGKGETYNTDTSKTEGPPLT